MGYGRGWLTPARVVDGSSPPAGKPLMSFDQPMRELAADREDRSSLDSSVALAQLLSATDEFGPDWTAVSPRPTLKAKAGMPNIGVANCRKLGTDMKPEQGFDNTANVLIYYWVQGYMSAANITTLESDCVYIDLSAFDEKKLLPMIYDFCSQNPDKKPISLIDSLLDKSEKISGKWKKGTIPCSAAWRSVIGSSARRSV